MTAPTNVEIARRLDEFGGDLKEVRADIKGLIAALDETYVRKDVYAKDQEIATKGVGETITTVLTRAENARRSTLKWAIGCGLAAILSPLLSAVFFHALARQ